MSENQQYLPSLDVFLVLEGCEELDFCDLQYEELVSQVDDRVVRFTDSLDAVAGQ